MSGEGATGDQAAEYVPEKVKKAEKKLEENPYDLDAWSILIREAQNQPIDKARKTYERLVAQFPSSGRFWKLYIEAEIKAKNYDKVEKIWVDYINFLKGVEAVGSYAENQRITAVRRVYQRGCVNPMINIEQLWRDYNKYEEGINIHLAKKMIEDRSRDYMNARRVAKEYETVMKGLDRNAPSVPPQNTPQEAQQVDMWKKYIQWEKSNPLRTEDQTLITKRVMFAYEQCLLVLGHHPDIWYEAAQYLEQSSKLLAEKGDMNNAKLFSDEAANIYERAISTLLKKNMLLYFAYADYEESRMKYEKVHNIYNRLLAIEDIDPTLDCRGQSAKSSCAVRIQGFGQVAGLMTRIARQTRVADDREIWARFLAFESNIGDLASILKVEKRRFTAFKEEYEGKETALLVDRYKFMDLYPCSASELKALGYKGPFVQVDELMEIFRRCKLPDTVDEAVRIITGGLPEIAVEGNGPVENNAMLNKAVKRPHEDSDDDEEKGSVVPPVHDIYRARQQKRIR
ncbi:cleavage stimulation factor subunit 3 [Limosa lapponica baueri]|uniref:Cleavage stimulation factor subunit 3 n=1 Tax=Limosa lapponica baueri TaxID=1758121 RepID=A0A2I0UNU9_LIMLA|nr:cleavage stimulation factor subunit 3 [Limosa lapponica baueri]